jgi:hypothetical protein
VWIVGEFNKNIEKHNIARAAHDLEIGLIERDLGFDLDEAIRACDEAEAPRAIAPRR